MRATTVYERPNTAYELDAARYAYIYGAKAKAFEPWLKACFPGRLAATSSDCLAKDLWLVLGTTPDALVVSMYGLDNGFLHELVAVAAQAGHEAIILEGNSCSGSTWEAFTHFAPGGATETVCHDPVRGLELQEWPDWLEVLRETCGAQHPASLREFYRPKAVDERDDWSLRAHGRTRVSPLRRAEHVRLGLALVSPTEAWVKLIASVIFLMLPVLFVVSVLLLLGMSSMFERGPLALLLASVCAAMLALLLGQLPVPLPNGHQLSKRAVIGGLAVVLVGAVVSVYWVTS